MKALLYPQIFNDIDATHVVLRRRHKTTVRMYRRGSIRKSSDNSSESDDSTEHFTENTESDTGNSYESNPFGFVKYYNGEKNSNTASNQTLYESFVDHGDADCTKDIFDQLKCKTSLSINRDSDGSFCFRKRSEIEIPARESLPICSKTVKLADTKTPSRDSVVHTSTARLNLGEIKQISENSAVSSFDNRLSGYNLACEDLVNLDESMKIKNTLRQRAVLDERHSMPTLFVGNRFNNSSMTEVYIPSWKDKVDIQKQSICDERDLISNSSVTTHSSSLDIPALIPVPDELTAEVLYNFDSLTNDNLDDAIIIKPPSMYDGGEHNNPIYINSKSKNNNLVLSRNNSNFSGHSLNSDLKLSNKNRKNSNCDKNFKRPNSVRRCISVQYVNLHKDQEKSNLKSTKNLHETCRCCGNSLCHSPRSSDSGMAGSCTIASPDPPKTSDEFYYPFEEYDNTNIENCLAHHQNDQLGGGLRHSLSSHNIGRFSLSMNKQNENTKENTDSGQYGDSSLIRDEEIIMPDIDPLKISNETLNLESNSIGDMDVLHKRQSRCKSIERSVNLNDDKINNPVEFCLTSERVYRTGLYAHWWKKEKLPDEIIRELCLMRRRNEFNNNNNTNNVPANIGEGSGKTFVFKKKKSLKCVVCLLILFLF